MEAILRINKKRGNMIGPESQLLTNKRAIKTAIPPLSLLDILFGQIVVYYE